MSKSKSKKKSKDTPKDLLLTKKEIRELMMLIYRKIQYTMSKDKTKPKNIV